MLSQAFVTDQDLRSLRGLLRGLLRTPLRSRCSLIRECGKRLVPRRSGRADALRRSRRADAHRPDAMNADKLPRTTAAPHLQSLWRKHDLTDAVVGFLDLNAICSLPALSKSFAAGQLRILCAAGTQAVIKRGIIVTLRDAGRDVVRVRERWDSLEHWVTTHGPGPELQRTPGGNHVAVSRLDAQVGVGSENDGGMQLDFDGERNCIKSFRMRCRYSGQYGLGGGDFILMSTSSSQEFDVESFLCRVYFQPNGGPAAGETPQEIKLLTWIDNSSDVQAGNQVVRLCDARPDQWYTVEAEFDWDASTAIVSVDGVRVSRLPFHRFPLRSLYLCNYSRFTSHFGAIDIEYYAASSRQNFQENLNLPDPDAGDY